MLNNIPVFILCGGLGTRLKEETEFRPKPMVPIGTRPILWHIMYLYSHYGFRRFILCLGFKSEVVKSYFLHYDCMNSDFTVNLATNKHSIHSINHNENWEVTLAYTGEQTMTGARVARAAQKHLHDAEHFAVTYGDGLTNANLKKELLFHLKHGRIGTGLGVNPPSRFGEMKLNGSHVVEFEEKPDFKDNWINGGFFFFKRSFLNYLSTDQDCVLEKKPLAELAKDNQFEIYKHPGFWACMDTQRDMARLNELWSQGQAPWTPEMLEEDLHAVYEEANLSLK
ncbi:glucose-1-phosphate cytidylyltransferase [Simkania negevensis]|uniref:Glucose-1-phosphate cytidylyltransferase n=1 Tax=Simkania negevensis TaxID=83561 RepID=A0ABS3AQ69_9BACT|nr:glucose-1-phosphate cytidylyltransferase [Simkania negevensis]